MTCYNDLNLILILLSSSLLLQQLLHIPITNSFYMVRVRVPILPSSLCIQRSTNSASGTSTRSKFTSKSSSYHFHNNHHHKMIPKSSENNSSESNDDNDLEKWEKMYNQNAPSSKPSFRSSSSLSTSLTKTKTKQNEIRVITFDLDNTLWKTNNVISAANDILHQYLQQKNRLHVPLRVEKIMGMLFQKDKMKYSPLLVNEVLNKYGLNISNVNNDNNNDDNNVVDNTSKIKAALDEVKTPVLLTQLRIDAIKEIYKNQTQDIAADEIDILAKEAFDIWTQARHDAIPHNLANSVIECLNQIRSLTTSYGEKVVIGAITDGNSNPTRVDMLKDYFDFCINAESVGISKPDRRVYDAAMKHLYSNEELRHVFQTDDGVYDIDFGKGIDDIDCDSLYDIMDDKWVHVGDDFLKDIVAAKELRFKTIFSTELVKSKLEAKFQSNNESTKIKNENSDKEGDSQLEKELSEKKVVNMIIGSEDFLLDSIQAEFADEIVHEFISVGRVITEWHSKGLSSSNYNCDDVFVEDIIPQDVLDLFTVVVPEDKSEDSKPSSTETKFCIICGTKLPTIANFCSSCGNKQ